MSFLSKPALATFQRFDYQGVRALGMGEAFIALADDSDAIWYNPAGLARISGGHVNIFDLTVGYDSRDTMNRMFNAFFKSQSNALLRTDTEFMRLGIAPKFVTKYLGFSLFNNFQSSSDLFDIQSINATVDIWAFNDTGAIGAMGLPIGDYISVGGSARGFVRGSIDSHLSALELLNQVGATPDNFTSTITKSLTKAIGAGYALGFNAGILLRVPLKVDSPKVVFGATYNDIGMTSFRGLSGVNKPKPIPPSLNFGTAWTYKLNPNSTITYAIDTLRWFEKKYTLPIHERIRAGVEFKYRKFSLRTGTEHGYWSWGFGWFPAPHTKIMFGSYAVELGEYRYTENQRHYQLQIAIGFNPL